MTTKMAGEHFFWIFSLSASTRVRNCDSASLLLEGPQRVSGNLCRVWNWGPWEERYRSKEPNKRIRL